MLDLYQDEAFKILKLGEELSAKWSKRASSLDNLNEFEKECTGRYAELGFIVNVDISPALVGIGPPDVAIVGRIDGHDFDHDRRRHEILGDQN